MSLLETGGTELAVPWDWMGCTAQPNGMPAKRQGVFIRFGSFFSADVFDPGIAKANAYQNSGAGYLEVVWEGGVSTRSAASSVFAVATSPS